MGGLEIIRFPCRGPSSQKQKRGCKTTVTSHTTHFDHPVLHVVPIDASLSADNAFSLNYLAFTIWEPDYVTLSVDYGQ